MKELCYAIHQPITRIFVPMNCSNSDNEKEGTFNSYDILITVGINSLIPLLFFLVFVNLINFTNLGWYNS